MSKIIEDQLKVYEVLFDVLLKDAPQKDELKEVIFTFIRFWYYFCDQQIGIVKTDNTFGRGGYRLSLL